ncbi:YihD family protein [Pantoea sp. 1.19]|uniref:YihD family protein n=1 Tax=Pantoea sp. 1.19 TaxID=1925589 RepID=UPI000948BBF3|nr:YihD family protein [Pantoea sp. 1.19]
MNTLQRLDEIMELLHPAWRHTSDLSLVQFIQMLAREAGLKQDIASLTDDMLIYQLKVREMDANAPLPGLHKDYEVDFKTALLRARGVLQEESGASSPANK